MTKLDKTELLSLINWLEYELYKDRKAEIDNKLTTAIRKLYINLSDQLYDTNN